MFSFFFKCSCRMGIKKFLNKNDRPLNNKGTYYFRSCSSGFLLLSFSRVISRPMSGLSEYFCKYFFSHWKNPRLKVISSFDKKINTFKSIFTSTKILKNFEEKGGVYAFNERGSLVLNSQFISESIFKKPTVGFRLFFFFFNKKGRLNYI